MNTIAHYGKLKLNVRYHISEENRIVVCVIKSVIKTDCLFRRHPWKYIIHPAPEAIGKAKCNPSDTWNAEIGKRIAYARAYAKICKIVYKRAAQNFNKMLEQMGSIEQLYENSQGFLETVMDIIEKEGQ